VKDLKDGVRGTMGYMSVEQVRGKKIGPQSDLFSVGLVLYELCTQRRFFSDQKKEIKAGFHQKDIAERLQNLPPDHLELREILSNALRIDLKKRYPSAKEMSEALDAKSLNMVQARQELVSLYQRIQGYKDQSPSQAKKESAESKNLLGFLIVLVLPMVLILTLFFGYKMFFEQPKGKADLVVTTKTKTKTIVKTTRIVKTTKTQTAPATVTTSSKTKSKTVTKRERTKDVRPKTPTKTKKSTETPSVDATVNYALLTISADESATVFIDGRRMSQVPLRKYRISSGKHSIVIAKDEVYRDRVEIELQSGFSYLYVWSFSQKKWSRKEKTIIKPK